MIERIDKITWDRGRKYEFRVRYSSGLLETYREHHDLPLHIVDVLVNGDCKTEYNSEGKIETFTGGLKNKPENDKTYVVTWDWEIGKRYWPQKKELRARNAKEACAAIKSKYIPGHTRFPFHVEAHRKED